MHCHCIQHQHAKRNARSIYEISTQLQTRKGKAGGNALLSIMGADALLDRESRVRRKVEAMCVARMSHPMLACT